MAWEREIDVCREVSRRAGALALQHAARGVKSEDKSDLSPVTIADRECEKLIVESLHAAFPDDGFLGEEGAQEDGRSGRRWIVDPIDGTRDFVRGLGDVEQPDRPRDGRRGRAGRVQLVAQGELYWAVRGRGAW